MKKWDCGQKVESRLKRIEETNPLLSFLLCSFEKAEPCEFEKKSFPIDDSTEVVFIDGVCELEDEVLKFLDRGGKLVFVEGDLKKIRSFIEMSDLMESEGVELISQMDEELKQIAWKYLYAKYEIVGNLPDLKRWLDGVHLTASDLHQSHVVVRNLQANTLRSHEFINGQSLKDAFQSTTAIVCGSGPSLSDESIQKIRALEGYALVIATGSSMPKLERAGIRIDFGVYVDPEPDLEIYQKMTSFKFPLFYQNRMCEKLFSLHKGEKIWMGESAGWPLDKKLMSAATISTWEIDTGWNAGTFGLQIASYLGCNNIVFVGLDNGMENNRELESGEYLVDNLITRRDLTGARDWIEEFIKTKPSSIFTMPNNGLQVTGARRCDSWEEAIERKPVCSLTFEKQQIDFASLAQFVGELNSTALQESLEAFLAELKEGVDSEGFQREKILLEVELEESILIQYVLKDLWNVTHHLFKREEAKMDFGFKDASLQDLVAKATFYLSILKEIACSDTYLLDGLSQGVCFEGMLEGEVRRSYPSGAVCAIEQYRRGKRHGRWVRLFESGDIKAEVHYRDGVLHGLFTLWGERGAKREGSYWLGKKDGRHRVFHRNGNILCEMKYNRGTPVGEHNTYNCEGKMIEKMLYITEKKFDRYCYNSKGDLTYKGIFKDDLFQEARFDDLGQLVSKKLGKWENEELIWD